MIICQLEWIPNRMMPLFRMAKQEHRQKGAHQRSGASAQACAAQQGGRDHLHLEAEPGVVLPGVHPREQDDAADRCQHAHHHKGHGLDQLGPDA